MRSLPLPSRDRKLSAKVVSLSLRQGGALGHGSIEKVTGVGRGEQGVDCVGSGRFTVDRDLSGFAGERTAVVSVARAVGGRRVCDHASPRVGSESQSAVVLSVGLLRGAAGHRYGVDGPGHFDAPFGFAGRGVEGDE